jgi:dipeptidyl aminopeptidase/acylaminoacyl peptidase
LLPRSSLFGESGRGAAKISPDGRTIAFSAPLAGVDNIWIAPAGDVAAATTATSDAGAGIRQFHWARDSRHLIIERDNGGDERWCFYSLELATGATIRISPSAAGETRLVALSDEFPLEIVVEINDRDPRYFDLHRINLASGAAQRLETNHRFTWFHADHLLRPRLAEFRNEDGSVDYFASRGDGEWRPLIHVPADDEATSRPFRIFETQFPFSADCSEIYAMDSRGRETAALVAWNLDNGTVRTLASDPRSDITAVLIDPRLHEPLACTSCFERQEVHALRDGVMEDVDCLTDKGRLQIELVSQASDDSVWTVAISSPQQPEAYYLYERRNRRKSLLFGTRPALDGAVLARMQPRVIRARDGLELVCYVTLPTDHDVGAGERPSRPLPLVLLIHGGPWIRDAWSFDPWVQLLANRGYAVLNVNYRGSRGFGKSFLNAGDREWGGRMYDDVEDAVHWAVDAGIAARERIAIMGPSFGGYTTLVGLTRSPELYACGVDVFGPSNLESFLESIPPHWKVLAPMWNRRLGSTSSPEERAALRSRSPLHYANRIRSPVLIAQGANDPRVVQAESDQMAAELQRCAVEVIYLVFPDEGHSFVQMPNLLAFFAAVEMFLAKHLGGRFEPPDTHVRRSSMRIEAGAELLRGF